jgi:alpha-amylase
MNNRALALSFVLLVACGPVRPARAPDGGSSPDQGFASDSGFFSDAAREPDAASIEDAAASGDAGPRSFEAELWRRSVIYFVLTDRFFDGDPSNNGDSVCFDPSSPTLFHGGDFKGLRDRLDYLGELGVDAVWITPVSKQIARRGNQCGYHGYWADLADPDDGELEPHLGSAADLTELVEEMHARNMKLIVDLVVNHSGHTARIVTQHPEWFHPREGCEALGPPDIYCPLSSLPDFAQEREEVATYLDRLSASWMSRFAFDGIRMDTVKHVPASYFADRWVPAVLGANPGLYLVGEIFDEGRYDLQLTYRAAGFHGFFDFPLRRALIQALAQNDSLDPVASRVQEAVNRFGIEGALLKSTFLDNHDVPRFLSEFPDGTSDDVRREKYHLALGVIFTTPGIPKLNYGNELGLGGRYPDNRRSMPEWAFAPGARGGAHEGFLPDAARTFEFTRALIRLRRETPALHSGGYAELWRPNGSSSNVYAFFRSRGSSRAIVAINAGDQPAGPMRMPLARNPGIGSEDKDALLGAAALDERLAMGASLRIEGEELIVTLPPRSMEIWTLD